MTKAQIVQNLLDEHQITPEHAVILLTNDSKEKEYIFIPQNPYNPVLPYTPNNPVYPWRQDPYSVTCEVN